jgi:four helix bundle protein
VFRRGFEDLVVYQRAAVLADEFRGEVRLWETLDIWTSEVQLVRAADSVAANIAEATGRETARDQLRHLVIARGSLREVQHWTLRARARELLLPDRASERSEEVSRLLSGLIRTTSDRTH